MPGAPLDNDASAGKVVFTFDDGPDVHTLAVIAELNELHVHGVFFMIGEKIAAHLPAVSAEIANGEVIGNHTWNHRSLTGKGTGTRPLTQAQVRAELAQTDAAIVAAGAPQPSLWRPPYGGVDGHRRRDGQDPRAAHRAGQRDQHHRLQRLGRAVARADRRPGRPGASATARSSRSTTG